VDSSSSVLRQVANTYERVTNLRVPQKARNILTE